MTWRAAHGLLWRYLGPHRSRLARSTRRRAGAGTARRRAEPGRAVRSRAGGCARRVESAPLFPRTVPPATGTGETAELGGAHRAQGGDSLRGARRGGQGRRDQAHHPAPQPAGLPGRRAARAERPRADPVVFPALRLAPAGRRRDRPVRSQLVQPRRGRAGHGFLQRRTIRGILPQRAGVRKDAGALPWSGTAAASATPNCTPGPTAWPTTCATRASARTCG